MSNRRKLSPQQTAQRDQGLASARNAAREPGTAVLVTDYAPEGMQCSWCDCPMNAHSRPGFVCDGCPSAAAWVLRVMAYTAEEIAYPLCEGHYSAAARALQGPFAGVPTEVTAWEEVGQ